jgi:hypothetical protein
VRFQVWDSGFGGLSRCIGEVVLDLFYDETMGVSVRGMLKKPGRHWSLVLMCVCVCVCVCVHVCVFVCVYVCLCVWQSLTICVRQDETLRRAKRVQMIEEEKRKATAENTRKKLIKAEQVKAAMVRVKCF